LAIRLNKSSTEKNSTGKVSPPLFRIYYLFFSENIFISAFFPATPWFIMDPQGCKIHLLETSVPNGMNLKKNSC